MPTSNKTGVFQATEVSAIIGISPAGISISGWSDGVFIAFRQLGDNVVHKQGASGESSLILSVNNAFEVDINVLQTSSDNLALNILHQASIKSGTTYPFQFDDASGQTTAAGGTSIFKKFPDFGYNKESDETRTWTLIVTHLELVLGGNT